MELKLLNARGLPEGCLVSIKIGTIRRQAAIGSGKPYRFGGIGQGKQQMKVDVFAPVAHARLLIEPCEAKCSVQLEGSSSAALKEGRLLGVQDMALDLSVSGSLSGADVPASDNDNYSNQASRPSSAVSERNAARRHQVALEAQPYFEQHQLMEVMQVLLQSVIKDKPADPYMYMMGVLKNTRDAAAAKLAGMPPKPEQAPRQRPASAQARTGPEPKAIPSALRPSSSQTPGARPRTSERVSWSKEMPRSVEPLSIPSIPMTSDAWPAADEGLKVEDACMKEETLLPSELKKCTAKLEASSVSGLDAASADRDVRILPSPRTASLDKFEVRKEDECAALCPADPEAATPIGSAKPAVTQASACAAKLHVASADGLQSTTADLTDDKCRELKPASGADASAWTPQLHEASVDEVQGVIAGLTTIERQRLKKALGTDAEAGAAELQEASMDHGQGTIAGLATDERQKSKDSLGTDAGACAAELHEASWDGVLGAIAGLTTDERRKLKEGLRNERQKLKDALGTDAEACAAKLHEASWDGMLAAIAGLTTDERLKFKEALRNEHQKLKDALGTDAEACAAKLHVASADGLKSTIADHTDDKCQELKPASGADASAWTAQLHEASADEVQGVLAGLTTNEHHKLKKALGIDAGAWAAKLHKASVADMQHTIAGLTVDEREKLKKALGADAGGAGAAKLQEASMDHVQGIIAGLTTDERQKLQDALGTDASLAAKLHAASVDELQGAIAGLTMDERQKLKKSLGTDDSAWVFKLHVALPHEVQDVIAGLPVDDRQKLLRAFGREPSARAEKLQAASEDDQGNETPVLHSDSDVAERLWLPTVEPVPDIVVTPPEGTPVNFDQKTAEQIRLFARAQFFDKASSGKLDDLLAQCATPRLSGQEPSSDPQPSEPPLESLRLRAATAASAAAAAAAESAQEASPDQQPSESSLESLRLRAASAASAAAVAAAESREDAFSDPLLSEAPVESLQLQAASAATAAAIATAESGQEPSSDPQPSDPPLESPRLRAASAASAPAAAAAESGQEPSSDPQLSDSPLESLRLRAASAASAAAVAAAESRQPSPDPQLSEPSLESLRLRAAAAVSAAAVAAAESRQEPSSDPPPLESLPLQAATSASAAAATAEPEQAVEERAVSDMRCELRETLRSAVEDGSLREALTFALLPEGNNVVENGSPRDDPTDASPPQERLSSDTAAAEASRQTALAELRHRISEGLLDAAQSGSLKGTLEEAFPQESIEGLRISVGGTLEEAFPQLDSREHTKVRFEAEPQEAEARRSISDLRQHLEPFITNGNLQGALAEALPREAEAEQAISDLRHQLKPFMTNGELLGALTESAPQQESQEAVAVPALTLDLRCHLNGALQDAVENDSLQGTLTELFEHQPENVSTDALPSCILLSGSGFEGAELGENNEDSSGLEFMRLQLRQKITEASEEHTLKDLLSKAWEAADRQDANESMISGAAQHACAVQTAANMEEAPPPPPQPPGVLPPIESSEARQARLRDSWVPEVELLRSETISLRDRTEKLEGLLHKLLADKDERAVLDLY